MELTHDTCPHFMPQCSQVELMFRNKKFLCKLTSVAEKYTASLNCLQNTPITGCCSPSHLKNSHSTSSGQWYHQSSVKQSALLVTSLKPYLPFLPLHILMLKEHPQYSHQSQTLVENPPYWQQAHVPVLQLFSWFHEICFLAPSERNKTVLVKAPYVYFTLYFAIIWYVVEKKCIETEHY